MNCFKALTRGRWSPLKEKDFFSTWKSLSISLYRYISQPSSQIITTSPSDATAAVSFSSFFSSPWLLYFKFSALLFLSRQAGGTQNVVKEVGLEPAIKLAKTALPRASSLCGHAYFIFTSCLHPQKGAGVQLLSCIGLSHISGSTSKSSPIPVVLSIFSLIGIGCIVRLCRVKSAPFFFRCRKGIPSPCFKKLWIWSPGGCRYYGSSDSQSGCLPRSRRSCL